jgi:AbrB family looped-hinge helix DNA binding protein
METTKLSSKGQVVLPAAIRAAHGWQPGVEFLVEDTADGVLLRPLKPFKSSRLEEVFGSTGYTGPARTVEEMDEAIAEGVRTDHARG